jgi:peptidoglycan/xylan/chitin deacetylase (PgdA/CDA1 family)
VALGDLAAAGRRRDLGEIGARAWALGQLEGAAEGARAYGVGPNRATFGVLARRAAGLARRAWLRAVSPWHPFTLRVRTTEKLIALTFDDGPDPATTPVLLDILARRGARATFFVIGDRAARHPDIVARAAAEGHEIGNHTWDHPSLAALPLAEVEAQIGRTRATLAPRGQTLMRPPYGDLTLAGARLMRRLGYRVVLWNINGQDWEDDDADTVAERILNHAAPGAIVLLHDSLRTYGNPAFRDRGPTFAAVERIIDRLPDYRFVTVSELLAAGRPVERAVPKSTEAAFLAAMQHAPDAGRAPAAAAAAS